MAIGDSLEETLQNAGTEEEEPIPLTPDIEQQFQVRDTRDDDEGVTVTAEEPERQAEPAPLERNPTGNPAQNVNLGEMLQVANQTPEDSPGTFGRVGNALRDAANRVAEPDVAQLLASFGAQLTPGEQDPLADFAIQTARGEARRRFREQIQQQGVDAAQDASIRGLQPQDRQQVLQQEREQNLAEEEQERRDRETSADIRQGDEELDIAKAGQELSREQFEFEQRVQNEELDLAESREERQQEAQRFDQFIQRQRLELDQQAQELEDRAQQALNSLRGSREELTDARAEEIRSGESGDLNQNIRALNRVAGVASEQANNLDSTISEAVKTRDDRVIADLPTSTTTNPLTTGTNVKIKAKSITNQIEAGELSVEDVDEQFLLNQGIPQENIPDVQAAVQAQKNVQDLRQQQERFNNLANEANNQVLRVFQGGQEGGDETSTEGVVEVETEEEARQLDPGTRFRLPDGRTGTVQGGN